MASKQVATTDAVPAEVQAFIDSLKLRAEVTEQNSENRSADIRTAVITRLLAATTVEEVIAAAKVSLPNMSTYVGAHFQITNLAWVRSSFESSDVYALVETVGRNGVKTVAAFGGTSVIDTLAALENLELLSGEWFTFSTRETGAGYTLYLLELAK